MRLITVRGRAVPDRAVVSGADLVLAVLEDLSAGVPVPRIAARFHNAVADLIVAGAAHLRR